MENEFNIGDTVYFFSNSSDIKIYSGIISCIEECACDNGIKKIFSIRKSKIKKFFSITNNDWWGGSQSCQAHEIFKTKNALIDSKIKELELMKG